MALTVDYQPFANGGGADVETQAQFLLDLANPAQLQNGFITGVAQTAQVNKVIRQSSVMTAAWANAVSQILGINVLDDGDVANLTAELILAIKTAAAPASTGDLKLTLKTAADAGWVLCNDGTIGNGASGATARANADTAALFSLLWTNFTDALCPVLPAGRGASAALDFAANKTIGLTKVLGRALAVAGAGAGLTARVLGSTVGEEAHAQSVAEMANHDHAINDPQHKHGIPTDTAAGEIFGYPATGGNGVAGSRDSSTAATGIAVLATGAGTAANVMQPTSFVNVMVKL